MLFEIIWYSFLQGCGFLGVHTKLGQIFLTNQPSFCKCIECIIFFVIVVYYWYQMPNIMQAICVLRWLLIGVMKSLNDFLEFINWHKAIDWEDYHWSFNLFQRPPVPSVGSNMTFDCYAQLRHSHDSPESSFVDSSASFFGSLWRHEHVPCTCSFIILLFCLCVLWMPCLLLNTPCHNYKIPLLKNSHIIEVWVCVKKIILVRKKMVNKYKKNWVTLLKKKFEYWIYLKSSNSSVSAMTTLFIVKTFYLSWGIYFAIMGTHLDMPLQHLTSYQEEDPCFSISRPKYVVFQWKRHLYLFFDPAAKNVMSQ